jgi:3-phenylpropionate/trans-cinnamate dioxygenase ferredoxin reductase subunit
MANGEHGTLVVVGAGQAGCEVALQVRQQGWVGPVVVLGDEGELPYQRPPLSKAFLLKPLDSGALALRPPEVFAAAGVTLRLSDPAVAIDRAARQVELASGERVGYRKLVLCTGGEARTWSCPGWNPERPPRNLLYLRTQADALALRAALVPGARVVVVGGGYVGLEVAASARQLGAEVTVLETQPRLLARVAGAPLSAFVAQVHEQQGVAVCTGVTVRSAVCAGDRIQALESTDGRTWPADVVVAGVGMVPRVALAQAAGLAGPEGVPVDAQGRTADPDVLAAGDCTWQQVAGLPQRVRVESVPNALDQARTVAATVLGGAKPGVFVPWFWSDQYHLKLQLAGLSHGHDRTVLRGDPDSQQFALFYLQGDRLLAVDAVNRPADFALVRKALAQPAPAPVDAGLLADTGVPLKQVLGL